MFDIMEEMERKFSNSMQDNLNGIFSSSEMRISSEVAHSIGAVLNDLFSFPHPSKSSAGVTVKKAPKDLGDTDEYNSRVLYNVIPGTHKTRQITDTLVIFCLGSDNLNTRLVDALIAVGKHSFKKVIFITSKWDISAITGNNAQRLQDLIEFMQAGTRFCFVLVSISGVSRIPVI